MPCQRHVAHPVLPGISRRRPGSTRNIAKMTVMCVIPREIATMLDPPQGRIASSGPAATVRPGNLPTPARATAKQCKIERHVRHVRHSPSYPPTTGEPGTLPPVLPGISRRRPRSTRNIVKMIVMCVIPQEIATMLDPPQGRIASPEPAATVRPGNLPTPAQATAKQCKKERHVRHSPWYPPTTGGPGTLSPVLPGSTDDVPGPRET